MKVNLRKDYDGEGQEMGNVIVQLDSGPVIIFECDIYDDAKDLAAVLTNGVSSIQIDNPDGEIVRSFVTDEERSNGPKK